MEIIVLHGNDNNDCLRKVEIDQHIHLSISVTIDQCDIMKKFVDIVFPDLDDKNARIELGDALSPFQNNT